MKPLNWLDVLVFTGCGLLLGLAGALVSLLFTGCGGQADSAEQRQERQEEQAQAVVDPNDRWCCIQLFPWNGQPYATCGFWGDNIPEDAVDCTCDSYLADCEGE